DLGFEVLPSLANFVLARHDKVAGSLLYRELKERGILVRWFDEPRIRDFVRITIGTHEEMQRLLVAVSEILQEVA
ncbi:MAG: aminotransferase class I/II-fold pyridoxal phosphate-dependent enzyme, partial [Firmicutes bacterium]|nr:aminotransferase class I/II-fold pyridoxal phosphate-dependent enzyme [Bacillota bacterium]